jgi:hypothetical protein
MNMGYLSDNSIDSLIRDCYRNNIDTLNEYDVNSFVRSFYNVNIDNNYKINLQEPIIKNGVKVDQLSFNKLNFIDCLQPNIWEQLSIKDKLNAINFAYYDLSSRSKELDNLNLQLIFSISLDDEVVAKYSRIKGRQIKISLYEIIKCESGIKVMSILSHELMHAKQDSTFLKFKELKKNNRLDTSKLSDYDYSMLGRDHINFFYSISEDISNYKFSENTIEYKKDSKYIQLFKDACKDFSWQTMMRIVYMLSPYETSAFNKEYQTEKSLLDYYNKNFYYRKSEKIDNEYLPVLDETTNMLLRLNNRGFSFSEKDLKQFVNLAKFASSEYSKTSKGVIKPYLADITKEKEFLNSNIWKCLKYLLDIYKNKKVTQSFDEQIIIKNNEKKNLMINANNTKFFDDELKK